MVAVTLTQEEWDNISMVEMGGLQKVTDTAGISGSGDYSFIVDTVADHVRIFEMALTGNTWRFTGPATVIGVNVNGV